MPRKLFLSTVGASATCWLRGKDLNLRPSGYEPDELPDCSTPRLRLLPIKLRINLTCSSRCLFRVPPAHQSMRFISEDRNYDMPKSFLQLTRHKYPLKPPPFLLVPYAFPVHFLSNIARYPNILATSQNSWKYF